MAGGDRQSGPWRPRVPPPGRPQGTSSTRAAEQTSGGGRRPSGHRPTVGGPPPARCHDRPGPEVLRAAGDSCLFFPQLAGGVILGVALWLRHDPQTTNLLYLELGNKPAPNTFYVGELTWAGGRHGQPARGPTRSSVRSQTGGQGASRRRWGPRGLAVHLVRCPPRGWGNSLGLWDALGPGSPLPRVVQPLAPGAGLKCEGVWLVAPRGRGQGRRAAAEWGSWVRLRVFGEGSQAGWGRMPGQPGQQLRLWEPDRVSGEGDSAQEGGVGPRASGRPQPHLTAS